MSAVVVMLHGFGLSRRFAPHNDIKWEFRTLRDARGCRFARLQDDTAKIVIPRCHPRERLSRNLDP